MTSNLELSMVNEQIHKLSQDQSSQSTVDKHASFGELWQNLCTIFSSFCWLPGTLLLSFILPLPRQSSAKPLASDTHCAVCCSCVTRAPDRCAPRPLGAIGNPNSSRPRPEARAESLRQHIPPVQPCFQQCAPLLLAALPSQNDRRRSFIRSSSLERFVPVIYWYSCVSPCWDCQD